jgi:lysophospholipase L1-like esterase
MTTLRICFVGDSITAGTGDDAFLGWPGRLCVAERQRGHDISLYNLGIRGDTSAMIASRWREECEARLPVIHPGALVFAFGINDTAREADGTLRVEQDRSVAIARDILEEAKAWKPTLMIGPTPVLRERLTLTLNPGQPRELRDARIAATSQAYEEVCRALGVPYLDIFTPLSSDARFAKAMAAGDGIHPTADGYAVMAELIGSWSAWREWFES